MLKLEHIKPAHVLDSLSYWLADMLKLAPILTNGLTDILKLADIIKTRSWLGLTGILTFWHVKIGWHFAKWADWHAETGRHNKNWPVMTQAECYVNILKYEKAGTWLTFWHACNGWLSCLHVKTGWLASYQTENLLTGMAYRLLKNGLTDMLKPAD